jgi:hypothetical protein
LEAAVDQGEAAKLNWAYLLDRVLTLKGEPQIFGTQFMYRDGELAPQTIKDPDTVDERRAELGMMPLAEYAKILEADNPKLHG